MHFEISLYFIECEKLNIILISFNCFSEYLIRIEDIILHEHVSLIGYIYHKSFRLVSTYM